MISRSIGARISGFYAILDAPDPELASALVRPVDQGGAGAGVLQVRLKAPGSNIDASTREVVAAARMARDICTTHGALLIVNDRLDIALAVDADGVHLGQDDLPLPAARAILARVSRARPFLVGVSTHDCAQIEQAVEQGADYLGFGPIFATATKAYPDPVQGVRMLSEAVARARGVPIVAIGGIAPDNVLHVVEAGARAACSVSAVNRSADPGAVGAIMTRAFG